MKRILHLTIIFSLFLIPALAQNNTPAIGQVVQEESLVFPGLLKRDALDAGNPLATYASMLDLDPQ